MSQVPIEAERKFYINDPESLPGGPEIYIQQWYLPKDAYSFDGKNLTISNLVTVSVEPGPWSIAMKKALSRDRPTVRIRVIDGVKAKLTIKGKTKNYARNEMEWPIDFNDAKALINSNDWPNVVKIRRNVISDNQTWEVDQFLGENEGLWLAEIEFSCTHAEFKTPSWVNHEVSKISELSSHQLAINPLSSWAEGLITRALENN